MSDPNNCGTCGYVCGNTWTCVDGACQLVNQGMIVGDGACLTIDAANVYFTTGLATTGAVVAAAKDGSSPLKMIATNQNLPRGIAVDAMTLYWVNSGAGTIMAAPLSTMAPNPLVTGESSPQVIAVDPTPTGSVYWTTSTAVRFAPKATGQASDLAGGLADPPGELAIDSISASGPDAGMNVGAVYWTSPAGGAVYSKMIGSNGVVVTVASGQATPRGIVVTPKSVFWTNGGSGEIMYALKGGGNGPNELQMGLTNPWGLVLDPAGLNLFWTENAAAGRVAFSAANVNAPIGTVAATKNPMCLAVDDANVYWLAAQNVWKAAR